MAQLLIYYLDRLWPLRRRRKLHILHVSLALIIIYTHDFWRRCRWLGSLAILESSLSLFFLSKLSLVIVNAFEVDLRRCIFEFNPLMLNSSTTPPVTWTTLIIWVVLKLLWIESKLSTFAFFILRRLLWLIVTWGSIRLQISAEMVPVSFLNWTQVSL